MADALAGRVPPSGATVQSWGDDADLKLIDLVLNGALPLPLRLRAMDALAALATGTARDFFVRLLDGGQEETELALARKALLALGWLRDPRVVAFARPLLRNETPAVRLDAIAALALSRSHEALDALVVYRTKEPDPGLQKKIGRQIRVLRKAVQERPAPPAPKPRVLPPPPLESRDSPRHFP